MGGSIGAGLASFISAYIEHEMMMKERKNQRLTKKDQGDQRVVNTKLAKYK
jgi:hypothetical protein